MTTARTANYYLLGSNFLQLNDAPRRSNLRGAVAEDRRFATTWV
jgi:hypothetical protein